MKRLIPILLFSITLSVFSAKAQLAPVGTKWTYGWGDMASEGVLNFTLNKDTIIDRTIYSCIGWTGSNNTESYWASENNKLYFYYNSKKLMFFDFNAKQRDTIYVDKLDPQYGLIPNFPIKIDSIYYYFVSNIDSIACYDISCVKTNVNYYERINISPKLIFGPKFSFPARGFKFGNFIFPFATTDISVRLRCYEEPNGYHFINDGYKDCSTIGLEELSRIDKGINVSPNPSSGIFQIEIKNIIKPLKLYIYDSRGDLVEQQNLTAQQNSNSFSVQLNTTQKSGMYYFVFELKNGDRVLKKVVLQQ